MMYTTEMNNRQYIFEATKIIETHLENFLSVKELSDKIGYSLYHFIRLFHGVVGCTPGEYLSARRLSRAAGDLLSGEKKVIKIALDYQFSSPEAFSRAFKKHSGLSPTQFRKNGDIKNNLSRLKWITPFYQDVSSKGMKKLNRKPEEIDLGEIFLAGRMVEVKNDYSPIGKLWNQFINLKPPGGAIEPLQYAQLSFWDEKASDDILYVLAAVQVDKIEETNTFLYKKVAPAKYLRFPHYGPEHRIAETYYWLFSTWLPETKFKLKLPYNMELYPAINSEEREKGISAWILLPLE
jgi:AraC family transcriptional regulator